MYSLVKPILIMLAKAAMRMMIRKLLKAHRYPPEGMDDAVTTVMQQCELWADNSFAAESHSY